MIKLEVEICCILGICCGGQNDRRAKAALAAKMVREAGVPEAAAGAAAAFILDTFDLAPKGTIAPYRDVVAALAREYEYEE